MTIGVLFLLIGLWLLACVLGLSIVSAVRGEDE